MDTVVSRTVASTPGCHLVHSLDGRTVCHKRRRPAADRSMTAAQPVPRLPARQAITGTAKHGGGRYVVIGSFKQQTNAEQWARFNADFGTDIQVVESAEPKLYRVLVGPLENENSGLVQAILDSVGVAESWTLSICKNSGEALSDGHCEPALAPSKQLAGTLEPK